MYLGIPLPKIMCSRRFREILSHSPGLLRKYKDSSKEVSNLPCGPPKGSCCWKIDTSDILPWPQSSSVLGSFYSENIAEK